MKGDQTGDMNGRGFVKANHWTETDSRNTTTSPLGGRRTTGVVVVIVIEEILMVRWFSDGLGYDGWDLGIWGYKQAKNLAKRHETRISII